MTKLSQYFRVKDWWNFIVAPVIAFYFIALLLSQNYQWSFKNSFLPFFAFLLLTIFTAAFGFLINEWSDIKDDAIAQKHNNLIHTSIYQKIGLLVFCLLGILVSAILIDWNKLGLFIFCLQLSLFLAYSLKPLRLKRFKYIALIIDALYSGTLFYILAIVLFSNNSSSSIIFIIFIWALLRGIRNFILHLLKDKQHDKHLEFKTMATVYSSHHLIKILNNYLLPLEIISYILLLSSLPYYQVFISIYLGFLYYTFKRKDYIIPFIIKRKIKLKTNILSDINLFYELFISFFVLIILIWINPFFIIFLPILILIFPPSHQWFIRN